MEQIWCAMREATQYCIFCTINDVTLFDCWQHGALTTAVSMEINVKSSVLSQLADQQSIKTYGGWVTVCKREEDKFCKGGGWREKYMRDDLHSIV